MPHSNNNNNKQQLQHRETPRSMSVVHAVHHILLLFLLAPLLLLLLPVLHGSPSGVAAIDLAAFTESKCLGEAKVQTGVSAGICYVFEELDVLSLAFAGADFTCQLFLYGSPDCKTGKCESVGNGALCLNREDFPVACESSQGIRSARLICPAGP